VCDTKRVVAKVNPVFLVVLLAVRAPFDAHAIGCSANARGLHRLRDVALVNRAAQGHLDRVLG